MDSRASLITTQSLPVTFYLRPTTLVGTVWRHRDLIRQLTWRNVLTRYRGSALGLAWSFIIPLLMLMVYTYVFGVVLKSRWGGRVEGSLLSFALTLYSGLLVYTLFSETLAMAPLLIVGNPNYVKKVVFPLEILPICTLGAAVVNFLIGVVVLLTCSIISTGAVSSTLYLFPLVLVPLLMLTLGMGWFLASLGVYLRDVGQFIGVFLQILMFLSPVFYSLEQVPANFRAFMQVNPLTPLVQNARNTLIWGASLEWVSLLIVLLVSAVVMQLGFVWFMKTKRGFADVL